MPDITVEADRIESMAAAIDDSVRGIGTRLESLASAEYRLTSQWSGEAADANTAAYQAWAQRMQTQAQIASAAAEAARAAATAYREADKQVGRAWSLGA